MLHAELYRTTSVDQRPLQLNELTSSHMTAHGNTQASARYGVSSAKISIVRRVSRYALFETLRGLQYGCDDIRNGLQNQLWEMYNVVMNWNVKFEHANDWLHQKMSFLSRFMTRS